MKQICCGLILLFFSCVPTSFSFGAKLSADQGLAKIIAEHDSKGTSFVQLFENYHSEDFSGNSEWNRFLKKLSKEDKIASEADYPELCFMIAHGFYDVQKYQEAYYFLYITLKEEKNINTSRKPYLATFHEVIGQVYYFFKRFDLSEKHLKIALHHSQVSEISKIKIYNTLSLIYRDKLDNKTSERYLQQAYNQAIKLKDEAWTGILSGNLGYIALSKK